MLNWNSARYALEPANVEHEYREINLLMIRTPDLVTKMEHISELNFFAIFWLNIALFQMFYALSHNHHHFLEKKKNNKGILKQIAWEIKKWHKKFSRPSGSWVI